MATINVKDAAGATVAIEKPLPPGRVAASASRPVALDNETKTAIDLINTNLTSADAQLPATLGPKTAAESLPVVQANRQPVNRSGTIAVGGTAQVFDAADPARVGFSIQNLSTGDLWVNDLGTASNGPPSIRIPPGQTATSLPGGCSTGAISIWGATTGQAFSGREY